MANKKLEGRQADLKNALLQVNQEAKVSKKGDVLCVNLIVKFNPVKFKNKAQTLGYRVSFSGTLSEQAINVTKAVMAKMAFDELKEEICFAVKDAAVYEYTFVDNNEPYCAQITFNLK